MNKMSQGIDEDVGFEGSNRSVDCVVNSVRWYGYLVRRYGGHVLKMASDFEVESQRKK